MDDRWFCDIAARCSQTSADYALRNEVVCKLVQDYYAPVIPPSDLDLKRLIMLELHASGLGGHVSSDKMLHAARTRFFWLHMRKDIERFCKECVTC